MGTSGFAHIIHHKPDKLCECGCSEDYKVIDWAMSYMM